MASNYNHVAYLEDRVVEVSGSAAYLTGMVKSMLTHGFIKVSDRESERMLRRALDEMSVALKTKERA